LEQEQIEDALEVKLREFIRLLRNHFPIEAVVLWGSHANGNPTRSSDIDVAVFSDAFGKNPLQEMASLCKLRRKIDADIEPLPCRFVPGHKDLTPSALQKTGGPICHVGVVGPTGPNKRSPVDPGIVNFCCEFKVCMLK